MPFENVFYCAVANYNRSMSLGAEFVELELRGGMPLLDCGAFALAPLAAGDPRLEYCLRLAHENMNPYLLRRGESFDDARWRVNAPASEFFLVTKTVAVNTFDVGFLSVRDEPDTPSALHIGDVQIEPAHQNAGAGTATLYMVEKIARARGVSELTLNVFRDNPALALYERCGYLCIDTQFYKYKMRKSLHRRAEHT
jgi:ribosomal protein S18 acetylase RimI-like enzyme